MFFIILFSQLEKFLIFKGWGQRLEESVVSRQNVCFYLKKMLLNVVASFRHIWPSIFIIYILQSSSDRLEYLWVCWIFSNYINIRSGNSLTLCVFVLSTVNTCVRIFLPVLCIDCTLKDYVVFFSIVSEPKWLFVCPKKGQCCTEGVNRNSCACEGLLNLLLQL